MSCTFSGFGSISRAGTPTAVCLAGGETEGKSLWDEIGYEIRGTRGAAAAGRTQQLVALAGGVLGGSALGCAALLLISRAVRTCEARGIHPKLGGCLNRARANVRRSLEKLNFGARRDAPRQSHAVPRNRATLHQAIFI